MTRLDKPIKTMSKAKLSPDHRFELLEELEKRFNENMDRHKSIKWTDVYAKLDESPEKLWSLAEMERTGGEPDVVGFDKKAGEYIFYDCSTESPKGRRSLCYDRAAWESRKEHKPESDVMSVAAAMGIQVLTEQEY